MKLNPYLLFNGQCEEAFKFYEKVLGGKIEAMMTPAGAPAAEQVPPEQRDKILHAHLSIGDQALMGSDWMADRPFEQPQGFSVSLQLETPAEAERVFNALAENGKVTMPLEQTFFAARFGMLTDQFGIPWMVTCDQAA